MVKSFSGMHWIGRTGCRILTCYLVGAVANSASASIVVDFEDLSLAPESFYNGSDGAGGFSSRGASFNNTFEDIGVEVWSGWSYSNMTDNSTPGYGNQYSAITGGGADGSPNYAIAFAQSAGAATIELPSGMDPLSMSITNSTYAALSMLDGDAFSKQFGGESGNDPDYFLLTITGLDANQSTVGSVEFYLADYRADDNSLDYIIDTWAEVDLSSLHGATSLSFGLESTDVGSFGINTPTYFAIDDLRVIPEPTTLALIVVGAVATVGRKRSLARRGELRCQEIS